jgi:hypothetical protein
VASPSSPAPHSTTRSAHEDDIEEEEEDEQEQEQQQQQDDQEEEQGDDEDEDEVPSKYHKLTWEKKLHDQRDQRSRLCSREKALM